jgi:hypothetical protein
MHNLRNESTAEQEPRRPDQIADDWATVLIGMASLGE